MSSLPDSDGEDDHVRIGWQPDAAKLRSARRDTSAVQGAARPVLRGDMIAAAAAPPAHARAAAPSRDGGGFGGAASFDFMDAFRAPPSDSDAARRGEEPSEEDEAMPWSDGEAEESPLAQQLPPHRAMAAAHSAPAAARTAARTGFAMAAAPPASALAPRRGSGVADSQTPHAAAHTPRGSNVIRGAALDFEDDEGEEVAAPPARPGAMRAPAQPRPTQARRGAATAPPARRTARDALAALPQTHRRSNAGGSDDSGDAVDEAVDDDDDDEGGEAAAAAGGADPAPPGTTPGARGAFAARLPRTEGAAPGAAPAPRHVPQGASLVARLAALVAREKQRRLGFDRALASGEVDCSGTALFRVVSQRREGAALALWALPACAAAAAAAGGDGVATLLVLPAAAAATSALRLGAGAHLRAHPPWQLLPLRGGKGNALLLTWNVSQL